MSFGGYNNGIVDNSENVNAPKTVEINKTITREFFESCNVVTYVGPTYVGVFLKRDFCINKK